jgi:hypothetical protein
MLKLKEVSLKWKIRIAIAGEAGVVSDLQDHLMGDVT